LLQFWAAWPLSKLQLILLNKAYNFIVIPPDNEEPAMKVIEAQASDRLEKRLKLIDDLRHKIGSSAEHREALAQETVISALQKGLDNQFTILRGVTLEGTDVSIPLILLGPPGVRVIYPSSLKGVFRAKEEVWEELDDRTQRFNPAKPNLVTRTQLLARAVMVFLNQQGYAIPEIEPVLLFCDPGIHVESVRPAVRIVQADALDRFAAGLLQTRKYLDPETLQKIVRVLVGDQEPSRAIHPIREDDIFALREEPTEPVKSPAPTVVMDRSESPLLNKIPFTRKQWIILGLLVAINIIILAVLVAVVVFSS
jgi:hypothetical protein